MSTLRFHIVSLFAAAVFFAALVVKTISNKLSRTVDANAEGAISIKRVHVVTPTMEARYLWWKRNGSTVAYAMATAAFMLILFAASTLNTMPTVAAAGGLDASVPFSHPMRYVQSHGVRGCAHVEMNWSSNKAFNGVAQNPHPGCVPAAPVVAVKVVAVDTKEINRRTPVVTPTPVDDTRISLPIITPTPIVTTTPEPTQPVEPTTPVETTPVVTPVPPTETPAPEPTKEKANCGVGNGVDGDTPGCPNGRNDGTGTGPGAPGSKGGNGNNSNTPAQASATALALAMATYQLINLAKYTGGVASLGRQNGKYRIDVYTNGEKSVMVKHIEFDTVAAAKQWRENNAQSYLLKH